MPVAIARTLVVAAVLIAAVACGYGTSATFNSDGSVTIGLKFLFPKALMQGSSGASLSGLSPADIAQANAQLASKYPGAKITVVTEGEDSGALLTVPFKTEKDAFAFLTQPSQLSPSGASAGTAPSINLANTGGLFASATHTTSGQTDTFTFKTQPTPLPSPSAGSQDVLTPDVLSSIFTITFSLTVPREITSAPDALFTQDRKTAIWKLSLTKPQTLTATIGPSVTLAGFASNSASVSPALLVGVGLAAIVIGFILGMVLPKRMVRGPAIVPATGPSMAPADSAAATGETTPAEALSTPRPEPPPGDLPPS